MAVASAALILEERQDDSPLSPGEIKALDGLSVEEFLALPEVKPALEYVEGRVTQKVPPQGQHSVLHYALCALFNQGSAPRRVAFAFPELRATHDQRSYVPDVAVYSWDRIPRTPTGDVAQRFAAPPEIAIEIVSPGQSVTSLVRKCLWFINHGVRVALLVDPEDRTIIVFRPGSSLAPMRGTDEIDLSDVIPEFRLSVAALFASLRLQ